MSNTIVTTADPLLEQAAERFAEILIAQWEEDHKRCVPPKAEPNENPLPPLPSLAHVSEAR